MVRKQKRHIEENLKKITRYGTVTYGCGVVQVEKAWGFLGSAVVGLECEMEIDDNLCKNYYEQVQRAAVAIADHLRDAGTSEYDLDKMVIGTVWEGSLCLILEEPDTILKKLSENLDRANHSLELGDGFVCTNIK